MFKPNYIKIYKNGQLQKITKGIISTIINEEIDYIEFTSQEKVKNNSDLT